MAYDTASNTMTFKNGEEIINSHVLNTNPTAEWTSSFRSAVQTDIEKAELKNLYYTGSFLMPKN